jgi:hypothetical protein
MCKVWANTDGFLDFEVGGRKKHFLDTREFQLEYFQKAVFFYWRVWNIWFWLSISGSICITSICICYTLFIVTNACVHNELAQRIAYQKNNFCHNLIYFFKHVYFKCGVNILFQRLIWWSSRRHCYWWDVCIYSNLFWDFVFVEVCAFIQLFYNPSNIETANCIPMTQPVKIQNACKKVFNFHYNKSLK